MTWPLTSILRVNRYITPVHWKPRSSFLQSRVGMPENQDLQALVAQAEAAGYDISVSESEDQDKERLILTFGSLSARFTPTQAATFIESILREANSASLRSLFSPVV